MLFKGLILLSAAGVKIREGKHAAAVRHAGRAATLLRRLMKVPEFAFERTLGMSPAALAEYAETAAKTHAALQATAPGQPQPVFNFILGSNSHGRPSGQVSLVTGAITLAWSEFPAATAAQLRWAFTYAHAGRRSTVTPPLLDAWAAYPVSETRHLDSQPTSTEPTCYGGAIENRERLLMEVVEA
jgi:hypothetical protein